MKPIEFRSPSVQNRTLFFRVGTFFLLFTLAGCLDPGGEVASDPTQGLTEAELEQYDEDLDVIDYFVRDVVSMLRKRDYGGVHELLASATKEKFSVEALEKDFEDAYKKTGFPASMYDFETVAYGSRNLAGNQYFSSDVTVEQRLARIKVEMIVKYDPEDDGVIIEAFDYGFSLSREGDQIKLASWDVIAVKM